MKKIPTLFQRDPEDMRQVMPELTPGCEWVLDGEGVATRKFDGTCVLIRDGNLFKRREVREGKPEPEGFELVDHDAATGKRVGWVPVGDGPEDRWHREAFDLKAGHAKDGTYELVGPKVQGNPESFDYHHLIAHGAHTFTGIGDPPRTFDGLKAWMSTSDGLRVEGIVWHHPDGRMAKLKRRDFPA